MVAEIDDVKMTLAITNLVENAIKYNHENGYVKVSLDADHQYFQIVLDGKKYRYQIFGYEKVLNSDKVYTLFEKNDREFESYIDYLNKISYNNTGVNVSVDDKIVTLSTCTNGEERFVVHGVLIDSYIY